MSRNKDAVAISKELGIRYAHALRLLREVLSEEAIKPIKWELSLLVERKLEQERAPRNGNAK